MQISMNYEGIGVAYNTTRRKNVNELKYSIIFINIESTRKKYGSRLNVEL